jgi:hypothetical protein
MQVFAGLPPADMGVSNPLYRLERAMGVSQHHDAVSGTSKQVRIIFNISAHPRAIRLSVISFLTSSHLTLTLF